MTAILKILGPGEAAEFPLGDAPVMIGRDASCDIFLDDPSASKKHAQVLLVDGEYILRDQNSHNGTFVGDERITHRVLNSGDVVRIGSHRMLFVMMEEEPVAGEIVVSRGDAAQASIAVASEVRRMEEQINVKIRELEEVEEKSQRSWSRLLTAAIVVAALGGLIVLMSMSREKTYQISGVELNTGYPQIIRIPIPKGLNLNNVECLDPDTLSPSGLLELNGLMYRKHPDSEPTDDEQKYDRALTEISGRYVFLRVTPEDQGRALLRIRVSNGAVYHMRVDVIKKPAYEWPEIARLALENEGSEAKVKGLLQRARGAQDANPAMALEAVKVARGLAGNDAETLSELDAIEMVAKKSLDRQWKDIRGRLVLAYWRNIRRDKISALENLLRLLPDPEDARHQWARIMLELYEKRRRK